ncbi:MAG: DNA methyltransferase [Pseudomonadota bacterium]
MSINQIICGESASVLSGFQRESVDLVVTDPPYLGRYKDRTGRTLANDDNPDGVLPVFNEAFRVLKPNSYCISFYGWTAIAEFSNAWAKAGFKTVGHIVWPKPYASRSSHTQYRHESAFVLAKGWPQKPVHPIADVQPWEYTGNKAHPTEKAVSVIAPLVKAFSKPGDVVLDPFAGSGTTAVASSLNGRRYIGIELEERYCAIARKRLAGVERFQHEARAA